MRFFYAKIGKQNSLANDFLAGKSPLSRAVIPLFFNGVPSTREQFEREGQAKEQGRNFFWCSDNPELSRIIVIHEGRLVIAKPAGVAEFWKADRQLGYGEVNDYIKLLPVDVICEKRVGDVPGILATATSNAYHYTGTFREFVDPGSVRALQSVLHIPVTPCDSASSLLLCLGAVELETLVAKMFEECGFFVPAYRGGAVKDIDIFAVNRAAAAISIHQWTVEAGRTLSIQVKRRTDLREAPVGCDALISPSQDAKWMLNILMTLTNTRGWLRESLSWLGSGAIKEFGIG